MSTYNLTLTFENIRTLTIIFLDIFVVWLVLYYAIKLVRSNSRTIQIFKGILLIMILDGAAKFMGLKTLQYFADTFLNWGFLAIIIIFQPEIRSILERIGKSNMFSRITTLSGNEKENLVDQIVTAAMLLSQDQTGALISIEQSHSLDDYIATGTKMNSDVTAELLTSIFVTSTPLHDGAVIIQGDKIACASAYFPPTNLDLPSRYGARHRAAIGISEITDAVTIIVSEETGAISITESGKIFQVNQRQLRDYLLRVICGEETEVRSSNYKAPVEPARQVVIAEDKKPAAEESIGNTGVLSKLAIKKQEKPEEPEKIEVEEVIANGVAEKITHEEDTEEKPKTEIEDEPEKKHHFWNDIFHKEEAEQPDAMDNIRHEMDDIKLPKKKERPAPSYPEQSRFQEEKPAPAPEQPVEVKEPEPVVQPEPEPVIEEPAVSETPETPAVTEAEAEVLEELEVAAAPRMTAEDVRKAREANLRRLSGKPEPVEEPEPEPEPENNPYEQTNDMDIVLDEEELDENARLYDTTKLDISKIVGLNEDLDKALNMVDQLKTDKDSASSENSEGGDR